MCWFPWFLWLLCVLVSLVSLLVGCPGGSCSCRFLFVFLGFLVVGVPWGFVCCFFVACCELSPYLGFFTRHRYARVLAPPFLYGWGATTRPLLNRRRGMLHAVADCKFCLFNLSLGCFEEARFPCFLLVGVPWVSWVASLLTVTCLLLAYSDAECRTFSDFAWIGTAC